MFTEEDTSHLPPSVEYTNVKCTDVKFTVADVNDKLAKLRPNKAAGPDNLLPRFLLEIKDFISIVSTVPIEFRREHCTLQTGRVLTLVLFIKRQQK